MHIYKNLEVQGGGEKNTTREGIYMYVGVEFCGRGCRKAHCPSVRHGPTVVTLKMKLTSLQLTPTTFFLHALSSPTLHRFLCSFQHFFYSMIPVSPPLTHTLPLLAKVPPISPSFLPQSLYYASTSSTCYHQLAQLASHFF
jgi:hypothetical protein